MTASHKKLLASFFAIPLTPIYACFGALIWGLSTSPMLAAAGSCDSPLVVKQGDTLSGISRRCSVPINVLLINNPQVDDSGVIHFGERLIIPATDRLLSAKELDTLLAPIALYPDIVLGEVLPASTYPLEIVKAARWLKAHPGKSAGDDQAWAASVKALTHYPNTLALLNDDIDWTVQLGESFLTQPEAVLDSVQRLRKQADVAGNLKDNSLQDIIREPVADKRKEVIRIVHADPDVVYVPVYDSHSVYLSNWNRQYYRPGIHFGVGLPLGLWVSHGLDWHFGAVFNRPYFANAYSQYYARNYYRNYRNNRRVITSFTHRAGLTTAERHWRHDYRHNRRHRTINSYNNHIDNRRYTQHYDNKRYDKPGTHDRRDRRNWHDSGQNRHRDFKHNRHNERHHDGNRGVVANRPRNAGGTSNDVSNKVRSIGEYNRQLKAMRGRDLNNAWRKGGQRNGHVAGRIDGRIERRVDSRAKRRINEPIKRPSIRPSRLNNKTPRQTTAPQKSPRTVMPVKRQGRRLQIPERRSSRLSMPVSGQSRYSRYNRASSASTGRSSNDQSKKSYSSRSRQVVR